MRTVWFTVAKPPINQDHLKLIGSLFRIRCGIYGVFNLILFLWRFYELVGVRRGLFSVR